MRILLLSSAFSGLTQRFYTELSDAGYEISVELHFGDADQVIQGVELFKPDLILCPYLTQRIPERIYRNYCCIIVHPGIKGDRGPSSLDWAIQSSIPEWGVTLLEADEEMDAGDIWASRTFPMRTATKSSLFNREVTQAAVDCMWDVLICKSAQNFRPEPLDYGKADVKGVLRPLMKQKDREIDWKKHTTREILNRINAADGSPGVLDSLYGKQVYLFNARCEPDLKGKPGEIIAVANHSICRATIDGALWIGHFKTRMDSGETGIKLPAAFVLKDVLADRVHAAKRRFFAKAIPTIEINYTRPGKQLACQEVWYELEGDIAYLYWDFHNGGMSTEQCKLLLSVYCHIATLPGKAIVLMGSADFWSNGIHLNHIEQAADPAEESWKNINAIDDLVLQIITTLDKVTICAIAGNAGAGGAILPLAADFVYAREGIIFNPHYKNMGGLYGSEYWTYLLPKRVGQEMANTLTERCLPLSAKSAWKIGLIDRVLDKKHQIFTQQVKNLAAIQIADTALLSHFLNEKSKSRRTDEASKPLITYRHHELTHMAENFFGKENGYHLARKHFVFKIRDKQIPDNIAIHRRKGECKDSLSFEIPQIPLRTKSA